MPHETQHRWNRRHLLTLEALSADEMLYIMETADSFKEVSTRSVKKVPARRTVAPAADEQCVNTPDDWQ